MPRPKNWFMWDGLSQPWTSAVHNSVLTYFNQSMSAPKLNNWPAYQVVDAKQFQITPRILNCQWLAAGRQRMTRLSDAVVSVADIDIKIPAPPITVLWCCKMERAIWDHCPTQAIQNLSYTIFPAFFQQWHFVTFEWNKFFCSEIASFSISQRSVCLKVKQKCPYFILFYLLINRANDATVLIWLYKFIYLLMKTPFFAVGAVRCIPIAST